MLHLQLHLRLPVCDDPFGFGLQPEQGRIFSSLFFAVLVPRGDLEAQEDTQDNDEKVEPNGEPVLLFDMRHQSAEQHARAPVANSVCASLSRCSGPSLALRDPVLLIYVVRELLIELTPGLFPVRGEMDRAREHPDDERV